MQMCIGALEAYLVRHEGNTGGKTLLETYGSLFGGEVELPDGKTFYSIEFFSVDTSAEMNHDSVVPNWKASELKADLLTSFFPQYSFLETSTPTPIRRTIGTYGTRSSIASPTRISHASRETPRTGFNTAIGSASFSRSRGSKRIRRSVSIPRSISVRRSSPWGTSACGSRPTSPILTKTRNTSNSPTGVT